jgi:hypothetical protein
MFGEKPACAQSEVILSKEGGRDVSVAYHEAFVGQIMKPERSARQPVICGKYGHHRVRIQQFGAELGIVSRLKRPREADVNRTVEQCLRLRTREHLHQTRAAHLGGVYESRG